MQCAVFNATGQLVLADPQPADMGTCSGVVLMSAAEAVPFVWDGAAAAEAFGWGFAMVTATWLVSFYVGSVIRALRVAAH